MTERETAPTSAPRALRSNLVWMVLGTAGYAGCLWAVLVMFAKLGNPEIVGYFALSLAYTAPVVQFFSLNLRVAQATDAQAEFSFGLYAGHRLVAVGLTVVTVAGFLVVAVEDPLIRQVTLWMALAKAIEMGSDVVYGLFQRLERMDLVAQSMLLRGVGMLVVMTGTYAYTGDLQWTIIAQAAWWGTVLVAFDLRNGRRVCDDPGGLMPLFDWSALRKVTMLVIPLGLAALFNSLYANLPRYFIQEYVGVYEVGIFSALAYLTMIGMKLVQAVGHTLVPRLAKYFQAGELRRFATLALAALGVASVGSIGGVLVAWLFGAQVLGLLYRPEYGEYTTLFVAIMVAGGLNVLNWLAISVLNATRSFRAQVPLSMLTITVCAVFSFLFRTHGMEGIAWAWIVAEVVQGLSVCLLIAGVVRIRSMRA